MSMGNVLPVKARDTTTMAADQDHTYPLGLNHPTVIPTNYENSNTTADDTQSETNTSPDTQ